MSSPAAEAAADALQTDSDAEQSPEGYTVFAVFRKDPARPDDLDGHDVPRFVDELDGMIAIVEDEGVTLRGIYDVSGLRADADVMLWLHGADRRGAAVGAARAAPFTACSARCCPRGTRWACTATPSSTRRTCPAFLRGVEPKSWLTVYPFVRSYEWYLLPPEERAAHARRARSQGRRVPRRHRQHGRARSRSATTSGSCRSRPTSSPTSSTSCATCGPPTPAGTCARRCRSTRAAASRRPSSWRCCSNGGGEPGSTGAADAASTAHRGRKPAPAASAPCAAGAIVPGATPAPSRAPRTSRSPSRMTPSCSPGSAGPRARTT